MPTVTLAGTQHHFTTELGETILDAALRNGVIIPYSCRGGSCGSCQATLLDGNISYPAGHPDALPAVGTDQVLLCQATAQTAVTVKARVIHTGQQIIKTLPARVAALRKRCADVMELQLQIPPSQQFEFYPGQYIDILLTGGARRSFSLASQPSDKTLELHIRQVPDGKFSTQVFEQLKEKSLLRFEGPFGTFIYNKEQPQDIIMVAGGTGFAPIKGLINQIITLNPQQKIHLYCGARSEVDLYMQAEIHAWQAQTKNITFVPVLSEPQANWQGAIGYVHQAVLNDFADLAAYTVYASGPPPMVHAIRDTFTQQGLPAKQLYADSFEYAHDVA